METTFNKKLIFRWDVKKSYVPDGRNVCISYCSRCGRIRDYTDLDTLRSKITAQEHDRMCIGDRYVR